MREKNELTDEQLKDVSGGIACLLTELEEVEPVETDVEIPSLNPSILATQRTIKE